MTTSTNLARRPLVQQLRLFAAAVGMTFGIQHTRLGTRYVLDGRVYTPGQAADLYLPGGWIGTYGQRGKVPNLRLAEKVKVTVDARTVNAEVIAIVGACTYAEGFVAILRVLDQDGVALPASDTNGDTGATRYLSIPA